MFFAVLCYLSVRSAAPELRRGQHGAGLPRGRSRAGGHGAGTELDFQGGRSRAGGYGAVSTELDFQGERSRAGGYGAVSRAGTRQTQELAGDQPEKMAGPDEPKNWWSHSSPDVVGQWWLACGAVYFPPWMEHCALLIIVASGRDRTRNGGLLPHPDVEIRSFFFGFTAPKLDCLN